MQTAHHRWAMEAAFDLTRQAQREDGHGRLFVLLDATVEIPPALLRTTEGRVFPVEHESFNGPPMALLQLNGADDPALPESLAIGREAALQRFRSPVSAWLRSPTAPQELAAHLQRCLRARDSNGQDYLFGYFSSRAMLRLPSLLSEEQWAYVHRPLHSCVVIDAQGELTRLRPPADGTRAAGRLRFTREQQARIERIGVVSAVLDALTALGNRIDQDTPEHADRLIQRYDDEYGVQDNLNRIMFAAHGLHVHALFDRHAEVQPVIRAAASGGAYSLATALNRYDEESWRRIRADLLRQFPDSDTRHGCRT